MPDRTQPNLVALSLRLRRNTDSEPPRGVFIPTDDLRAALTAICGSGVERVLPVFDVERDLLRGVLIEATAAVSLAVMHVRYLHFDDCAWIPSGSELFPRPGPGELRRQLGSEQLFVHPQWGWFRINDNAWRAPADLIQRPQRHSGTWDVAVAGTSYGDELGPVVAEPTLALRAGAASESMEPVEEPVDTGDELQALRELMGEMPASSPGLKGWSQLQLAKWIERFSREPGGSDAPSSHITGSARRGWQRWAKELLKRDEARRERQRFRELHQLLQWLREDPDRGLRYAIPLSRLGSGSDGWSVELTSRGVDFDLAKLSVDNDAGESWQIPADVLRELSLQYLELANLYRERGDARRSAYIFAHLLGDLDAAADVLRHGGHALEGGILYRDHLHRPRLAALCFEQAQQWEEAARLFEAADRWVDAGRMWEQLDDVQRARALYRRGVEQCLNDQDPLGAAELLESRLGEVDEAIEVLDRGWRRARAGAPCFERLCFLFWQRQRVDTSSADALRARLWQLRELHVESGEAWVRMLGGLARRFDAASSHAAGDPLAQLCLDCARVLAARLLNAGAESGVLQALVETEPDDSILARDAQRFAEQERQFRATPTIPSHSSPNRIHLDSRTEWRQGAPCDGGLVAFGVRAGRLQVARVFLPTGMVVDVADVCSVSDGELQFATNPWSPQQLWVAHPSSGGIPRVVVDSSPESTTEERLTLGTPEWWPRDGKLLRHLGGGRLWSLSESTSGVRIHVRSERGEILESRGVPELPRDPGGDLAAWGGSVCASAEYVARGQRLLCYCGGLWRGVTVLDNIRALLAWDESMPSDAEVCARSAGGESRGPTLRSRCAVALEQGGLLVGVELDQQIPFASGFSEPVLARGALPGEIWVAAAEVAQRLLIRNDRVRIEQEWHHGLAEPVAMVGASQQHAVALLGRSGELAWIGG